MPNTQAGQFISIMTPLGDDVLLLRKFTGDEGFRTIQFSLGASFREASDWD